MCQNYNNDPSKDTFTPSLGHDLRRPPPLSRRPCAGALPGLQPRDAAQAGGKGRLADDALQPRLAQGLRHDAGGHRAPEAPAHGDPRPLRRGQYQHRALPGARACHHHLSLGPGAVGPLPHGTGRARPGLRPAALRHRGVSQAGHGDPRLARHDPLRTVDLARLPPSARQGTAPQKTGWRRLSRPLRRARGALSCLRLRRTDGEV